MVKLDRSQSLINTNESWYVYNSILLLLFLFLLWVLRHLGVVCGPNISIEKLGRNGLAAIPCEHPSFCLDSWEGSLRSEPSGLELGLISRGLVSIKGTQTSKNKRHTYSPWILSTDPQYQVTWVVLSSIQRGQVAAACQCSSVSTLVSAVVQDVSKYH